MTEELEFRLSELREALQNSDDAAEQYRLAQQMVEIESRLARIN